MRFSLCNEWEFVPAWSAEFGRGEGTGEPVRLPHTVAEVPLHYADPSDYEMISGYRRKLHIPAEYAGKRLFLQFDGAGHIATVFINGTETVTHRCGYTAFRVEITDLVQYGTDNLVAVRLDSTENPTVPPFGFVIDYLTYGGLYREAWLDVREQSFISDIYIATYTTDSARVELSLENAVGCRTEIRLLDAEGNCVLTQTGEKVTQLKLPNARVWSAADPYRYTCQVVLEKNGVVLDKQEVEFGFRTAEFKADGFYLNGEKYFLRGLNRHQCWPYMGYAAPESLQREDARILKEELSCTAVRTSHYPQSQYFIDECDRLGLLVFTEIPGWQHIGDESWQDQACENTREMVLQYRNHPSVVLWGVRINESGDRDEFYRRTNAIAHELDPSRQTSGVRCMLNSSLLEDVYAYNDFSHEGTAPGVRKKKVVTKEKDKGYLVSEHSGHMFPTKACDNWPRRQEHALRHTRVQDAAAGSGEHAGCFGWCMVDYATHKDFGSGDRVCYHGVMDAFRNPKLAAAVYASQGDERAVLELSTTMDIGDYDGSQLGDLYIFTNGDEVDLYKNGRFITTLSNRPWKNLPHGPILLDDTIGNQLEEFEGYPKAKAEDIRKCLLDVKKYGMENLPLRTKLRMAKCFGKYKMTFTDAADLYGKYVGSWGMAATVWRVDAKKDGKVVKSVICCPSNKLHLEVTPSATVLRETDSYDMAAVRIRVLNEFGELAPFASLPMELKVEGPAQLVGPEIITAEGGMCGTYLKTTGQTGKVTLTVTTPRTPAVTVEFEVK